MAELKSFASLSSTLLARKGSAKPAMRPQGWGQGMGLEDLGWNDMGGGSTPAVAAVPDFNDRPEHVPSSIAALTPAPRSSVPLAEVEPVPSPVVEQQRVIEASFAEPAHKSVVEAVAEPVVETVPEPVVEVVPALVEQAVPASVEQVVPRQPKVVALPLRPRQAAGSKGKAAFTLRLDAERHLRLRLACAVTHRSAQQLVTEALDTFLATLPELEAMAGHVPIAGKRS
jgi:hypothetical protein